MGTEGVAPCTLPAFYALKSNAQVENLSRAEGIPRHSESAGFDALRVGKRNLLRLAHMGMGAEPKLGAGR
jgi:hypothetical protein